MSLKIHHKKTSAGFVLLYSVIITTVLLVIGVSLMNIMTKQLVLSSISRNSKLASYAALAGYECAEYWKNADGNYFGQVVNDGTDQRQALGSTDSAKIACPKISDIIDLNQVGYTTRFKLNFPDNVDLCADVMVTFAPDNSCGQYLRVESHGYNSACDKLATPSPRQVESVYSDRLLDSTNGCQ